jgi:hypothetical protein
MRTAHLVRAAAWAAVVLVVAAWFALALGA